MKEGLDKIDEIFKQAFDGFEAHVDPNVWTSVQQSIGNTILPKTNPSLSTTLTKSLLLKVAAGVVAVATVAVSVYVAVEHQEKKEITAQSNIKKEIKVEKKVLEIEAIDKGETNPEVKETPIEHQEGENPIVNFKGKKEEEALLSEKAKLIESVNISKTVKEDEVEGEVTPSKAEEKKSVKNSQKNQPLPVAAKAEISASIIASSFSGKAPLEIQFEAEGNGIQYFWDFGDGSELSNEKSLNHTFVTSGVYKVSLTVIDKSGNSKTVVNFIEVEKNVTSTLMNEIPNVITPNGDGSNDELKITGENIKVFNARIMKANSEVVYEWNNIDGAWNGRDMNGNILMPGTYYLTVIAVGYDGERHTKKRLVYLYK